MKYRYIASCVFTRDYPELSLRIQDYLKERLPTAITAQKGYDLLVSPTII